MNIVNRLEDTLNGGYGGLYGEVVTCDTYRLRQMEFKPDIIFDIGANVGIFSRFARSLFPNARIIAVEPDPENAAHFRKFTQDPNTHLMEYALGSGQIFHGTTAVNGAHETYLSVGGLGYPDKLVREATAAAASNIMVLSNVPSLLLTEILEQYWKPGTKALLKVDCEGAENCIWQHKPSMKALSQIDYIAMELHDYALTSDDRVKVLEETNKALHALEQTHICTREGVNFWATKK